MKFRLTTTIEVLNDNCSTSFFLDKDGNQHTGLINECKCLLYLDTNHNDFKTLIEDENLGEIAKIFVNVITDELSNLLETPILVQLEEEAKNVELSSNSGKVSPNSSTNIPLTI